MATLMFYTTNFLLVYHPHLVSHHIPPGSCCGQNQMKVSFNACTLGGVFAGPCIGRKINGGTEFIYFISNSSPNLQTFNRCLSQLENLPPDAQKKKFKSVIFAQVVLHIDCGDGNHSEYRHIIQTVDH